jgi:hypothetical protein
VALTGCARDGGWRHHEVPFDLRRTQQLVEEAGFLLDASEGRLEFQTVATTQNEGEDSAFASMWKQAGLSFNERLLPPALAQDNETRATFTAFADGGGFGTRLINMVSFNTPAIASPANRWSGLNRGGWSHS